MTRRFTCGLESGDTKWWSITQQIGNLTWAIDATSALSGSRGLHITKAAGVAFSGSAYLQAALIAGGPIIWQTHRIAEGTAPTVPWRFRFYLNLLSWGPAAGSQIGSVVQIVDNPTDFINVVTVSINGNNTSPTIRAQGSGANSSTIALSKSTAYRVEVYQGTANGTLSVYNKATGALVGEVNIPGGFAAGTTFQVIDIGMKRSIGSATEVSELYLDDFAFNDSLLGDSHGTGTIGEGTCIGLVVPNGAGSFAEWTRAGTDSGANWSQVDEWTNAATPVIDTDYNKEVSTGTDTLKRDAFALANYSGSNTVRCVSMAFYMKLVLLGENVQLGYYDGSAWYTGNRLDWSVATIITTGIIFPRPGTLPFWTNAYYNSNVEIGYYRPDTNAAQEHRIEAVAIEIEEGAALVAPSDASGLMVNQTVKNAGEW